MMARGAWNWRRGVSWGHAGALATGILLAAAFPPFQDGHSAWVALVPLLLVLFRRAERWHGEAGRDAAGLRLLVREAFGTGFLAGLVFWGISLSWMLTLLRTSPAPGVLIAAGYAGLAAYCALYLGAFAMTVAWCAARLGLDKAWKTILLTPAIAVLGVGFEYVRGVAGGGFPWNTLGISQYRNTGLIQCAEWFGVAGVSAMVLLLNAGIAFTILRYLPGPPSRKYRPHVELFLGVVVVALSFRAGMGLIRVNTPSYGTLVVAGVQPAIPQEKKWTQDQVDANHATLRQLTEEAVALSLPPDIVIWPETATPYPVNAENESLDLVQDLTRQGVPLLVGSMVVTGEGAGEECFNSSLLFDARGKVAARYDKQHLVPFGEYIPFSGLCPFLGRLAPMGWNCSPGREATMFRAGEPAAPFSVLICFEDILGWLSRKAVLAGARLLVNQTNDAWFDRSAGPEQHLSHCVFRSVENRVPVIRVANTGISCLIQPSGRIEAATANSRSEAPEARVCQWMVHAPPGEARLTFYTRHGDLAFAIPCAAAAGICFVLAFAAARRKSDSPIRTGEQQS